MHTAENTGFNPSASVSTEGVTERWTFGPKDTASDDETNGFGDPVYARDTLYVGGYERLWALDPADGSEQWRYDPDHPEPSDADVIAVGVADGTVYVGTDHGTVAAVEADDGTEQWRAQVGESDGDVHEGEEVRILGLTAAEGYVLAMEDGTSVEDAVLHALDASDGSELWQRTEGAEYTKNPRQPAPPAIHDGVVYDAANGLVALDAETGEELWDPREPRSNDLPAYDDGTLYISAGIHGDAYYAVDAETGETAWKTPFEGGRNVSARLSAVDDERVYAGEHNGDGVSRLVAFDRENGSIVWTNDEFTGGFGGFSVDADAVYVDDMGTLAALDPADGSVLWRYESESITLPAVVDSTAYVGGGTMTALEAGGTPTPTETDTATDTATPTDAGTKTGTESPTPTDAAGSTATPTDADGATPTPTGTESPAATGPTDAANGSPRGTTGGGPGLGILATLGGLSSVAGYYLYRNESDD